MMVAGGRVPLLGGAGTTPVSTIAEVFKSDHIRLSLLSHSLREQRTIHFNGTYLICIKIAKASTKAGIILNS